MAVPWKRIAVQVGRVALREGPRLLSQAQRTRASGGRSSGPARSSGASTPQRPARTRSGPPAGRHLAYAPQPDGRADPGEVVWTWVAYEDDPRQGKDRPVLVVGRAGADLLGLMLSSKDHAGDRGWLALGAGTWDAEGRPSWVRLDRVLEVPEDGIRREGAVLDEARFARVAAALRADHDWR